MSEVEDLLAIQQLIAHYAVVVDRAEFDELDELFTPDARIDFATFGGPVGDLPTVKAFLASTLPGFTRTQHLMGLPAIELDGDRASARTSCTNPMVPPGRDGTDQVWLIGLWYDDEFVRTDGGWRFASRVQQRCYTITGFTDAPLTA